jgi:hypothetical protein
MQARVREYEASEATRSRDLLGESGFDVRCGEGRSVQLQLWGPLPATWAAALGTGLFQAGIRVVRGYARRVDGPSWLAEFDLEALDDAETPVLVDYLSLARTDLACLEPAPVRLTRYHRSLTAKHGGSLFLEVRAADRLGFLGGLLTRVARAGLVPEELVIETYGMPVLDRFFLKTEAGEQPGAVERRDLGKLLVQLSQPESAHPTGT